MCIRDRTCSYLILCRAVRAAQIQPALLRQILRAEGYAAPRIAEIASVCFCSAELFADYESRLLGWRAVLRRIRTARGDDRHQRAWLRFERSLQELDRLAVAAEGLEVGALVGVVICPSQCVMGRAYKLDVGRTCVSVSVDVAKETKKTNEKIRVNGKSP